MDVDTKVINNILGSDFVTDYHPFTSWIESLPAWDGKTDYIREFFSLVHYKDTSEEIFYHLPHRPDGQPPLAAVPRRSYRQSLDCRHPLRRDVCPGLCPRKGWRAILAQRQADKGAQRAQQTVSHARPGLRDDCHIFYYTAHRVGDQVYDCIEDSRQVCAAPNHQCHEDWHRLGKPWI